MILEGILIGTCIYNFIKEQKENQQKKVEVLAEKLNKSTLSKPLEEVSFQEKVMEIIAPFATVSNQRGQQMDDPKKEEIEEVEENLQLSTTMLGVATMGLFVPQLHVVTVAGLLWASRGIYKTFFHNLFIERKINGHVVDTLALSAILATGHYVLTALGEMMYYAGLKLLLKTEHRSTQKLVNLFGEKPKTVWLVKGEVEIELPFEQLKKGDVISINAGETIPIDGHVIKGAAAVNQQSLTGEDQPVEKAIGDPCFASTFLIAGSLHIEVAKAGEETVVAQIEAILKKTTNFTEVLTSKGKETGDKLAPPVLALSGIATLARGAASGAAVINANFGYILELISPMMVLNFLTITSQEGILVKDGRSLELLHKVDAIIFDKTGTLTLAQPHVGNIHALNGLSEDELLTLAAAAEYRQTHPIALAILDEAKKRNLDLPQIESAKYEVGYGIKVMVEEKVIHLGSERFMEMEGIKRANDIKSIIETAQQKGYSIVQLAIDRQLHGLIELHPTIRPEAKQVIKEFQESGKACYIISGDNEQPTKHLAQKLGVNHYVAEVLPKDKADWVTKLQKQNKMVCFIGDGINDTIALKKADVSISIRGASTVATDTAQIVLMSESLKSLPLLFTLGDEFEQHMNTNLGTAILPGAFAIGGIFFLHLGMTAAVMSSLSSLVLGVGNAIHPMVTYQQAKWKKITANQPEETETYLEEVSTH